MPRRMGFEYRDERDSALFAAYYHQIDRSRYVRLHEVMGKVVDSPSPRFWVSPERAASVVSYILRGGSIRNMTTNKRRMFHEIVRRVRLLRQEERYRNCSLADLARIVVEQPAPSFYITPKSAVTILHLARKRRRCLNTVSS